MLLLFYHIVEMLVTLQRWLLFYYIYLFLLPNLLEVVLRFIVCTWTTNRYPSANNFYFTFLFLILLIVLILRSLWNFYATITAKCIWTYPSQTTLNIRYLYIPEIFLQGLRHKIIKFSVDFEGKSQKCFPSHSKLVIAECKIDS